MPGSNPEVRVGLPFPDAPGKSLTLKPEGTGKETKPAFSSPVSSAVIDNPYFIYCLVLSSS